MQDCYDLFGIGFGPANVALAIANAESDEPLRAQFIDSQADPVWHGGMLLERSNIQNHPCRDLVTLRNPRSRYTFLNYLFEKGRLVQYLNLPTEFPLRKDYAQYISWVTHQFDDTVDFGERATAITIIEYDGASAYAVTTKSGRSYIARALVLATGRAPYIPPPFDTATSDRIFHLEDYLYRIEALPEPQALVVVIGGSQSAVEITLDLAKRYPRAKIINYLRGFAPRLKDTSPFSEEGFFPQFTDYYFKATRSSKHALDAFLRPTNYSSVDMDVLHDLYLMIYEQRLDGDQHVFVLGNRRICGVEIGKPGVWLKIEEIHTGAAEELTADFVVLATGFRDLGPGPNQEPYPALLADIIGRFQFDDGYLTIRDDYRVTATAPATPPLFINGLCETTHGIGDSGSFSLLSLRAATILGALSKALAPGSRQAG